MNNSETDETFRLWYLLDAVAQVVGVCEKMSKRRWVEFKICQTISCSAPVSRRRRASSPAAAAGMFTRQEFKKQDKEVQFKDTRGKIMCRLCEN